MPAGSGFLHPEIVHGGEGVGVFGLHRVPAVEVAHRPAGLGEQRAVALQRGRVEFEADEAQALPGDEVLDGRDGQAAFLHVEQQVAAFAGAEEIVEARQAAQRRVEQILPAAADVGGRRAQ